ncbi:DUF6249 domain-containing protein [Roseivirga misakiensis]|uniref:DUF6249 domain-containing protein n=1 Tax=Roseivirga misakiensis TaxID=1563681 RepID=A0A1E5T081_9BACT|nr:DUF6249 domain-containing protein [Roseivirga misakiensis]OEK04780.1 hypothetical protein BFP71_15150 [Roseivirga misakiensis]
MEGFDIVLTVLITFAFTGFTTIGIIKGITSYRLRRRMIEAGLINEEAMELLKDGAKENYYTSLKWGLILFFSGIGLIIINSMDYYYDSTAAYGIVITAASLGFLIYFIFMKQEIKKEQ